MKLPVPRLAWRYRSLVRAGDQSSSVLKGLYAYDRARSCSNVEAVDDSSRTLRHETISFAAA